ncbi:PXMP2/4 family protein 4-like [Herrania umbratica]|uniref:PXMP2/4 family protein 4-like n=1 Tax=Herrania umbratica TaxID=108875 RepID=A0A6J1AS29_9ROSI|nr:PXMP2/4 family protein 4-like [Herrania umbratica]
MSGAMRKNASIIRLLQKQPFTDLTDPINRIHPFLRNQTHAQTREYFRFPNVLRKVKEYEISPSLFASSFSSSSSSSTRVGLVGWYLGMVKSWPVLTKSVTSSLIYVAADLSSQTISKPSSEPYDLVRTSRMAGYGMLILGPSLHFWFNLMSKLFPKRDLITTFKKMAMGQLLYGPAMTVVFFSLNARLQGERSGEIVARLQRDLVPTMLNGVMYWPFCDFITFRFIPVPLQPLVSNSFSYLWTVYMTYMASLAKPATITS